MSNVIEASSTVIEESPPASNMALQRYENAGAVGKAMTVEELHSRLEFVRDVMRKEMREDQDYGKIPGAGEKPTLLQPGAQKLLMVFNLTAQVKKEVLREFPSLPMHREYEFTITVRAANGKEWDGVGTCSTLESKYRWRKGERVCPKCGKPAIIKGKEDYGGGYVCWKKKDGCDAKFASDDKSITTQSVERQENEDPADQWNTVRKMAYKRALVHGAINATNTSELWTQDLESGEQHDTPPPPTRQSAPAQRTAAPVQKTSAPVQQKAPAVQQPELPKEKAAANPGKFATAETRKWALKKIIEQGPPQEWPNREGFLQEFLIKSGCIMPNETAADWPLAYVPVSQAQVDQIIKALIGFGDGNPATFPFHNGVNPADNEPQPKAATKAKPADKEKAIEVPREGVDPSAPDAPWQQFRVPYGKHAGIELGKLDSKVLWGFWKYMKVELEYQGRPRPANKIASDQAFRAALDEAGKHHEFRED